MSDGALCVRSDILLRKRAATAGLKENGKGKTCRIICSIRSLFPIFGRRYRVSTYMSLCNLCIGTDNIGEIVGPSINHTVYWVASIFLGSLFFIEIGNN